MTDEQWVDLQSVEGARNGHLKMERHEDVAS
jgi:hypothetical protein